jgi:hypothetical protein
MIQKGRIKMAKSSGLTPPKVVTFIIAVILAALGVVAKFVAIPFVSDYYFWFVVAGFVLLALASLFKGL